MLRSRFLWKLYAGYVALIVMAALVFGLLQSRRIGEDARADTVSRLREQAVLLGELARPVLRRGAIDPAFQADVARLGAETGSRFTVILRDGAVLADSHEDPAAMDDHRSRPEVLQAKAEGRAAAAERYSQTLRQPMVYLALPVLEQGRLLGYARTSRAAADLTAHIAGLRGSMALGVLIVAAAGCVVGLLFARGLTRRLRVITEVSRAMAAGDHRRRVAPLGGDEVGTLGRAFNAMAERLERRFEAAARERAELVAILESMVEGVVAVDREQRIVLINGEARRILATPGGDLTGRPVWEVTPVTAVSEIIDRALRGQDTACDEVAVVRDGGDLRIALLATPLRAERPDRAGAVVVLQDLTELRRLETVRRDFVANVSHELKTPLTAIHGFVETLIDDPDADPERRRRFLGKVRDHTDRLVALVTDLLTLSRLEAPAAGSEHRTLDLREPLRASAALLLPRAEQQGLTVHTELPDRAVPVRGDAEALRQAVDNLLDNAIKYTPAGGTVWLRLRERGGHAVLEVQDTGVGFEPRHRERIFERFYRVDRARSRELGGTGLGLSIVKNVAQAHGGQVSADSVPGGGSTFRVTLPLATSATA